MIRKIDRRASMPAVIFIIDEEIKFCIFALVAKLTINDQSNTYSNVYSPTNSTPIELHTTE